MKRLEFNPNEYRRAAAHQTEWGRRLIAELNLTGQESILDLGCGDGVLTAELAALAPQGQVVGIDISAGMIEAAQKLACGNLAFQQMDIDELSFHEEFDVVFSNSTLQWIPDHRRLLGNIHRALRAGGFARLNFAGEGSFQTLGEVLRTVMAGEQFAGLFASFRWPWVTPSPEDYQKLVSELPWSQHRVWGENADRLFPTRQAIVGWMDQPCLVPFPAHLPAERRQSFRDAVVEAVLARTKRPEGYFETFRRVYVLAWK